MDLFVAVGLGFFAGTFGYVLYYFFLSPLLIYKRLVKRVLEAISEESVPGKKLRLLSEEIFDCVTERMPVWLRLKQKRDGTDPLKAATLLMKLSNTQNQAHREKQVLMIKKALNLK